MALKGVVTSFMDQLMPLVPINKIVTVSPNLSAQLMQMHLELEGNNCIARNLRFRGPVNLGPEVMAIRLQIGPYSYIARNSRAVTTSIGSYCCIAHNVEMGMGRHLYNHPSVSQSFFKNRFFMRFSGEIKDKDPDMEAMGGDCSEVRIGNDVWVGAHVKFPGNATVGHGAVIGTGTIVTKDVPPYAVVVGGGGGTGFSTNCQVPLFR